MNRLKLREVVEIPENDPIITFKKLEKNMISPYQKFKYRLKEKYSTKKFNLNVKNSCTYSKIYSASKSQLTNWNGVRVFECNIWGKCILKENKIGSEFLELKRELNLKEFVGFMSSKWAYEYCKYVKDKKEVRDRITKPYWAYLYCKYIKDRKEVRDRINESEWAYFYCLEVKDRKEVRNKITKSQWAYYYCLDIRDRKEIRDRIIKSEWAYYYCLDIRNRKEIRNRINKSEWAYYCSDIRNRKKIQYRIDESKWVYYCLDIKDREEGQDRMRKHKVT